MNLASIRRHLARLRGSGVVVAVSGGGDSVGLLRVLQAASAVFDLRLSVAHLDHGTRGEEGRGDARFVADLARSLDLPFDLGHWQATRSSHFEADARQARYSWLVQVAQQRGSRFVAVGQTLDDQAETILHRIVRGTGLRGLAGIPARRGLEGGVVLVRPLLEVARIDVRNYLEALGQGFRDDSTNQNTSRTRARIRLELLPELGSKYNPNIAEALVRLGQIAADSNRTLERIAIERLAKIRLENQPDRVVLDRPSLTKLPRADRLDVLRLAWREAGWPEAMMNAERWRRLADLGGSKRSVGSGVEAEWTTDRLILARSAVPSNDPARTEPVELPVPGRSNLIETTFATETVCDEWIDVDTLKLPLTIRPAQPGDRFEPLGLGGKSQPLNDFFRGRKVPKQQRGLVPIVCDQAGIVWVAGHRIAHRVRLTEQTRRKLGLRFDRG